MSNANSQKILARSLDPWLSFWKVCWLLPLWPSSDTALEACRLRFRAGHY